MLYIPTEAREELKMHQHVFGLTKYLNEAWEARDAEQLTRYHGGSLPKASKGWPFSRCEDNVVALPKRRKP